MLYRHFDKIIPRISVLNYTNMVQITEEEYCDNDEARAETAEFGILISLS
jgi:hypothetical protein